MIDIKDQHLIVFAKYPDPGQVKKRLAIDLGENEAAALYRCMVEDTVGKFSGRQDGVTCFISPWSREIAFQQWLGEDLNYSPQTEGDLGQRMRNAFYQLFESGWHKVVLIGTDIPTMRTEVIGQAYGQLDSCDCVIGPAFDGGYYLIGFKAETFTPSVFEGVSWSSGQVLSQTAQILKSHNRRVKYLKQLYDIDTLDDLRTLREDGHIHRGTCDKTMAFVLNLNL